jgi:hypothetical protein
MRIAIPQTSGLIAEDHVALDINITPELRKQAQAKFNLHNVNKVEIRIPTYASLVDVSQLQSFIPATLSPRKSEQGEEVDSIVGQSFIPNDEYFRNTDKRGVWAFYLEVTADDLKHDKLHVIFVPASDVIQGAPANMLIAKQQQLELATIPFAQRVEQAA